MPARWTTIAILIALAAIVGAAIFMFVGMPPRRIVMATGPEGGAYHELGKRYQAALARENVELRLITTAGAVENVALLRDSQSDVDIAFVQSGLIDPRDRSELQSLGTLFYEPCWWFRKHDAEGGVVLPRVQGLKISIGPEGSGTHALSLRLLTQAGLAGKQTIELLSLPTVVARERLLAGDLDAAFLIDSWDAPIVQQMLADDAIGVASYVRADALVALHPYLSKLVVPRGAASLATDRPPADVTLIATKASLIVRKGLHPAIQYLLLRTAQEIHRTPSIFNRASEFPAAEAIDVPLSDEAQRYYKSGLPMLHDYLPFWMATLVGKLVIVLIPIFGVLYPVIRLVPQIYDWMIRSRVMRMYGQLRSLETEIARTSGESSDEIAARIDRLAEQARSLKGQIAYATQTDSLLSALQTNIHSVRESAKPRPTGVVGAEADLPPTAARSG